MTSLDNFLGKLRVEITPQKDIASSKVSIIGSGQVGMASCFAMMLQHVCSEIAIIDIDENKLRGEWMDIVQGQAFIPTCKVHAGSDYALAKDSRVVVITAGVRQREGETRTALVQRNVAIFIDIIGKLMKHCPDAVFLIISNPVDILTWLTKKISGVPASRVLGSGTALDSARFRFLLSQKLSVATSSTHGYIIGEHGDTSVPVWSGVSVGGVRLRDICSEVGKTEELFSSLHNEVINSAYEIIKRKGYTSWAIGVTVSTLVSNILNNRHGVFPVSVNVKGMHGIEEDVCLSLPCVLGENGVTHVLAQNLSDEEIKQLQRSAKNMAEIQKGLTLPTSIQN